ncbi:hypothetical protein BDN72DRAFT_844578 [Pluteus cervinus]|uniref:Uncharacterized protein n=1 Tax=Pluteus cervinus TaxID=181527 RepID=A0ACD3AKM8_9AGAR|nr:hypothetical protein BDN72DRAFT_844578 [Pluteus cervinus]
MTSWRFLEKSICQSPKNLEKNLHNNVDVIKEEGRVRHLSLITKIQAVDGLRRSCPAIITGRRQS